VQGPAGLRRIFLDSVASLGHLAYAVNRAGVQAVPMVGFGHLLRDHATNMHADDLRIAISFPPCVEETVAVVETARQRGNAVLALTNSTVSPITDGARAVLAVEDAELHGFRSLSALICLVQTLVMGLAYRKRRVEGGIDIDAWRSAWTRSARPVVLSRVPSQATSGSVSTV